MVVRAGSLEKQVYAEITESVASGRSLDADMQRMVDANPLYKAYLEGLLAEVDIPEAPVNSVDMSSFDPLKKDEAVTRRLSKCADGFGTKPVDYFFYSRTYRDANNTVYLRLRQAKLDEGLKGFGDESDTMTKVTKQLEGKSQAEQTLIIAANMRGIQRTALQRQASFMSSMADAEAASNGYMKPDSLTAASCQQLTQEVSMGKHKITAN